MPRVKSTHGVGATVQAGRSRLESYVITDVKDVANERVPTRRFAHRPFESALMIVDTLPDRIVRYPDPCLREKCRPIEQVDASVAALADRMLELMKQENGVGLAGPQVGVCRRIFVANPTGQPEDDMVFVNPELSDLTGSAEAEEGCLSLPDVRVMMRRARTCRIQALDVHGQPIEMTGEDLIARIWQHEHAHLEGDLIIDHMNGTDKIANKKAISRLEEDYKKAHRTKK